MRKVHIQAPTSSNNSATSSENSETQSVEDHQTNLSANSRSAALIRAKSSWKRMKELASEKEKENEAKRPPWRAVSVSTLSKPDKNALLRAKLLDASRRLRAGKVNVALQTDFTPTKLMKEASTGSMNDLIVYKDIGILTDGQYSIKKDGYHQYVLTYSISQMTDCITTVDVSTQTLLPKAFKRRDTRFNGKDDIHNINTKVDNQIKYTDMAMKTLYSEDVINSVKLNSTLASWHFDDDAIEMELKQHFIPYTIESYRPWRSFNPIPFHLKGNTIIGRQKIDWYALLESIDNLVRHSNNLLDRVEEIFQEKDLNRESVSTSLDEIRRFQPRNFEFPSEHWLPIIEKQEKGLQLLLDTQ